MDMSSRLKLVVVNRRRRVLRLHSARESTRSIRTPSHDARRRPRVLRRRRIGAPRRRALWCARDGPTRREGFQVHRPNRATRLPRREGHGLQYRPGRQWQEATHRQVPDG